MKIVPRSPTAQSSPYVGDSEVIVEALRQSGLLAGFDEEQVEWIARRARACTFPAGTDVFVESEPCEGIWLVAVGHVRLYHSFSEGRQQIVGFLAQGSTLDLAPGIDGGNHSMSATAMDDAVLILLPREILSEIAERYPILLTNTMWQLCLEIRKGDIKSAVAAQKDARGRISCTLLQLVQQHGIQDHGVIRINCRLTRQDVADRAGVRIETAIRVLSDMQRQGVIRTQAQLIDVLDLEELQRPPACDDCLFDCSVFAAERREGPAAP